MERLNIPILVLSISLVLSLLSGMNQIAGFVARISLGTAIASVLLAVVIAVLFPTLIRQKQPDTRRVLGMPLLTFSLSFAALVLVAGVGPFAFKFWEASTAKAQGATYTNTHRFAAAQAPLERATKYFADLGFQQRAVDARLELAQTYEGMGDWERADDLINEIVTSAVLDSHGLGRLNAIRGNIAYGRGEFEQAERYYQLAAQTVEPGSQAEAALLQNQAVLWSQKSALYADRVRSNHREAREIYQRRGDAVGLVQLSINEGNLLEDPEQMRQAFLDALAETQEHDVDDPYLLGVIALNIGVTYGQADVEKAESYYLEALAKFEEAADLFGQAEVRLHMATAEEVRGRMEAARQHLQASEAYLQNLDQQAQDSNARRVAVIRTSQADIYSSFGESDRARGLYEAALSLYAEHPDPLAEVRTLLNFARLFLRLNLNEDARNLLERARESLSVFAAEGAHQSVGVLYSLLGRAFKDIGEIGDAEHYYNLAADTFQTLQNRLQHAMAKEDIGVIRALQMDIEAAGQLFEEALATYRDLGNKDR